MKKERIRINLDVSPELAKKLKAESDAKDITLNATIRLILQQYFEEKKRLWQIKKKKSSI